MSVRLPVAWPFQSDNWLIELPKLQSGNRSVRLSVRCPTAPQGEKEELLSSTSDASKPLLKQIESMAAAASAAAAAAAEAEVKLTARLRAAEVAAAAAADAERAALGRAAAAEAAAAAAKEAAAAASTSGAESRSKLEALQRRVMALEAEKVGKRLVEALAVGVSPGLLSSGQLVRPLGCHLFKGRVANACAQRGLCIQRRCVGCAAPAVQRGGASGGLLSGGGAAARGVRLEEARVGGKAVGLGRAGGLGTWTCYAHCVVS